MRIAFFTECYHPTVNGVVISVATYAAQLRSLGVHVAVIAPATSGYKDQEPAIYRLPSRRSKSQPTYPIALPFGHLVRRILDAERPQLIHTHSPFVMGVSAALWARRTSLPLVFTFHTIYEKYTHYIPVVPQPAARVFAKRYSRAFADRAQCVIAPSEGIAWMLKRQGVGTRIEVLPTGINLALAENLEPIRGQLGLPQQARILLYAGRLAKEKNLETLLQAFRTVAAEEPQAHLVLAGGGPWLSVLQQLASRLGLTQRAHLPGMIARHDVFRWAAESEAFVFPSVTDTQGLVVAEAMATGAPCVAVNSLAVMGLVRNGENGLLTENSPESLARALLIVLRGEDLRRRMSAGARETAALFSVEACAQRLAAIYEELITC
jgi:glycosyltransferase involved in cell wall biosynthesis